MSSAPRLAASGIALFVIVCGVSPAQPSTESPEAIANWSAPPYWSPQKSSPELTAVQPQDVEGVPTPALAFTGITPCRIADTRGNGFTGQYGPPSLAAGSPRNFALGGQCGIAGGAEAVSLNITVTTTLGPGFILIYPQGGAQPTVSTLNYVAGQTIANAAVVPLGAGGGVTIIAGVSGTDLIIDTNGYYAPQAAVTTVNGLSGAVTLAAGPNVSITPAGNTLTIGTNATSSNTPSTIVWRDATGFFSASTLSLTGNLLLPATTSGVGSVMQGGSRILHTFGTENVFVGTQAGNVSMTGSGQNTGVGHNALTFNQSGVGNTAVGRGALWITTTGSNNTAVGLQALQNNEAGGLNTAIGTFALFNNAGSGNIALGFSAGSNFTVGQNNIAIGHNGVETDSATIRIGTAGFQTKTFLAGVRGTTIAADGLSVMIDSLGQLGTALSSASVKREIADIGESSSPLMKLRPVSFFYRDDTRGILQYGLVAEEVARVMPELVQYSPDGLAETVRYHFLAPLLLNELQKQEKEIQELRALVEALSARSAGECSPSR